MGGWLALPAVLILGPRMGRYVRGKCHPDPGQQHPLPGARQLDPGDRLVRLQRHERQNLEKISGLVAVNSLMAMVGGVLAALVAGKNDPGFIHNGALAGLIAICAGCDIMHPLGAFFIGGIASLIFVYGFQYEQEKLKIDDVLGVWPLHGMIGTWGGIAAGIFGHAGLGGMGGVSFLSQLAGSLLAIGYALAVGFAVYALLNRVFAYRLNAEEEFSGADMAVHHITAYPEEHVGWGAGPVGYRGPAEAAVRHSGLTSGLEINPRPRPEAG